MAYTPIDLPDSVGFQQTQLYSIPLSTAAPSVTTSSAHKQKQRGWRFLCNFSAFITQKAEQPIATPHIQLQP